jgi:hypothetical protein
MHSHIATPGFRRTSSWILAGVLAALAPSLVWAGPREDMKAAYAQALAQANELEYDAALATLNNSISASEAAGAGQDPVLASLYVLRAALTFSLEGGKAKDKIGADLQRALTLNYYVVVPVEMRSDDLAKFMDQARKAVGASAAAPITHTPPTVSCGQPLLLEALLGVPDGGQAALYWRKAGSGGEFIGAEMPAFSNVAEAIIPAAEHGDGSVEYFIFAFDESNNPVANLGTQEQPLVFEQTCEKVEEPVGPAEPAEEDPGKKKKKPSGPSSLPRVWINLGIGTGFGIATGAAENTYRQFFPRGPQTAYGAGEAGCAIARWVAGNGDVTALTAAELGAAFETYGNPELVDAMIAEFNAVECAQRHPVSTGFASAPLHIAPEVSVRIGSRVSLGLFSRLQVVTGAKAFREDPTKDLPSSFTQDVRSATPIGVKQKIKFSWTIGAKFKYFLGKEDKKLRPYVGAFVGYGTARLRVDMGFSNDRNGNSVPDALEAGSDSATGADCFPVWPYNGSCDADTDSLLANQVSTTANKANRVDVVRIGSGFVGALVGFNYQIVKNFALFGELQVGAWFPNQTSLLFDLTVGPSITF